VEGLEVDNLAMLIASGSGASHDSAKPTHASVVGSMPTLLSEEWVCFQACVCIALMLRERSAGENAQVSALIARIDALLPEMRTAATHILSMYGHPALGAYIDALHTTPAFPSSSPFSHEETAARFLAASISPSRSASPTSGGDNPTPTTAAAREAAGAGEPVGDPAAFPVSPADLVPAELSRRITSLPGNECCAECGVKDATWASVNLGITLCLRCSGAHRQLGVHISQVRSITLDKWKPVFLQACLCIGNTRSNNYWERNARGGHVVLRPSAETPLAEVYSWMKDKYERRVWAAKGSPPEDMFRAQLRAERVPVVSQPTNTRPHAPVDVNAAAFDPFPSTSTSTASTTSVLRGVTSRKAAKPAALDVSLDDFGAPSNPTAADLVQLAPSDFEFSDVSGSGATPVGVVDAEDDGDDDDDDGESTEGEEEATSARLVTLRKQASLMSKRGGSDGIDEFTFAVEQAPADAGSNWWQSSFEAKPADPAAAVPSAPPVDADAPWWSAVGDIPPHLDKEKQHEHASSAPAAFTNAAMVEFPPPHAPSSPSEPIAPEYMIHFSDITLGPRIGVGGFAIVNRGTFHDQTVAVKQLLRQPEGSGTSPESKKLQAEFLAEVRVMTRLRHPNIVTLVGVCLQPLCLITEYCARGNLHDILIDGAIELDWPRRLSIALGAAKGMAYLHSASPPLLHRDLKSQNIFITEDWTAKIGDFGLSRLKAASSTTLMTSQCGTFHWMAPELISSFRYNEKVDVYSFGINMWELATRKIPYEGMQPMQIGYAVVHNNLRPDIPSNCSDEYVALMQECWAQDPAARPRFIDVVARLEALVATMPV
jgi:hypothetical protein